MKVAVMQSKTFLKLWLLLVMFPAMPVQAEIAWPLNPHLPLPENACGNPPQPIVYQIALGPSRFIHVTERLALSQPEKIPVKPEMLRVGRTRRISTANPATVPSVATELDTSVKSLGVPVLEGLLA